MCLSSSTVGLHYISNVEFTQYCETMLESIFSLEKQMEVLRVDINAIEPIFPICLLCLLVSAAWLLLSVCPKLQTVSRCVSLCVSLSVSPCCLILHNVVSSPRSPPSAFANTCLHPDLVLLCLSSNPSALLLFYFSISMFDSKSLLRTYLSHPFYINVSFCLEMKQNETSLESAESLLSVLNLLSFVWFLLLPVFCLLLLLARC